MRSVLKGLISTETAYRAQFCAMRPDQVAGDISPSYLNEEQTAERIKALLGPVKIIIMLRNPVDRVISQYMHLRRAAREDLTLEQALRAEDERRAARWGDMWHYSASAYAAERVRRYFDTFGEENVLVVLADDLRRERKETLATLCRFIGVADCPDIDATREFNRSGLPRSKVIARLVDASPLASAAKAMLPRRLGVIIKRKLQDMNTGAKEEIPAEVRTALSALYADEITQLDALLRRPTGWK